MTVREIKVYPDQILRRISKPLKDFNPEIDELIDDMLETIHTTPGVGLAAVQVGVLLQIVTIDPSLNEDPSQIIVLINPEVKELEGKVIFEEGCLSVPEFYAEIERTEKIEVRALDREGKPFEFTTEGLLARIIQHEVDHLNGKLFVDLLPKVRRDVFKRKWIKERQEVKKE